MKKKKQYLDDLPAGRLFRFVDEDKTYLKTNIANEIRHIGKSITLVRVHDGALVERMADREVDPSVSMTWCE